MHEEVIRLARRDAGRVTAVLAGHFGDLDLADESVQDALVEAVATWPERGVPDNPAGWLLAVARRKGIDRIRRTTTADRRLRQQAHDVLERVEEADERGLLQMDDASVDDEHLRLVLLCAHPALAQDAQVALTLRLVGGLTTAEIAAALLVPEGTVTQRIVRAKRKIREAAIPLRVPEQLDERVDLLLSVLYLIFNEGYLSRGSAEGLRVPLADEAIRLTRLAHGLLPHPELGGLLALMLFQRSRFATRVDTQGELVRLEDQDRAQWDRAMIDEAGVVLDAVLRTRRPGVFQVQAVIASLHARARTWEQTDWTRITRAYGQLVAMSGSPVAQLNRAVAVGMSDGPLAGLAELEGLSGLEGYHLLHATRADLLERADRHEEALSSYVRAAELATNPLEQRHLERRIARLTRP